MKTLVYKRFTPINGGYNFLYAYDGFEHTITVTSKNFTRSIPDQLVEHFGLSLCPYLFNLEDFDVIELETMRLTGEQKKFFEWYFVHGLAEHRYVNAIDPSKPIHISCSEPEPSSPLSLPSQASDTYLVMIGGGKDSLVGLEIITRLNKDHAFFAVNVNRPSLDVLTVLKESDNLFNIELTMYPETKERYKYSGHKPGSSFWAFASLLAAYSSGYGRVVVSNEHSANYAQLTHGGFPINHQFSKSFEFEKRFNDYVVAHLLRGYRYFSVLRPLYELQIAKIFAQYLIAKFQDTFISCNVSYAEGKWCESCPKCAFVFIMLAPFMDKDMILRVWSKNLLEKEDICAFIYDLGSDNVSPLECVGTPYETKAALHLAREKGLLDAAHPDYKERLMALAADVKQAELHEIMQSYEDNNIPDDISDQVRNVVMKLLAEK